MNPGRPANTPEVLWSKVDVRGPGECWPWKGWCGRGGYGRTEINGKPYYAHRVIFALANPGQIELAAPRDKFARGFLMHSCDNRACCNPAHLRIGTQEENNRDKAAKGRAPSMRGDRSSRARLTSEQAANVRWLSSIWLSSGEIARAFGVSKGTVKDIVRGRAY